MEDLARGYFYEACAAAEAYSASLRQYLRDDAVAYFDRTGDHPTRPIDRDEADAVRAVHAVPYVSVLAQLTEAEILNLADTYEGWAHDPRFDALEVCRLLGWADQYRALAVIAGPGWRPYAERGENGEGVGILPFVALMNRLPR